MSITIHLHPASVHFPIALLLIASSAGLLYIYWRPHLLLLSLTWWPMLLGWIGGGLAILSGLVAQSGLPPDAPYRGILNWHIGTGLALMVTYGVLLYQRWIFNSARAARRRQQQGICAADLLDVPAARFGFMILALLGILLVVASGWNGGRLVYEWGVNVVR